MALGAPGRTVVRLIVRQAMVLVVAGVAAGTIAALFLSQTMTKMLFGVTPTDPLTFGAVARRAHGGRAIRQLSPARPPTRPDAKCGRDTIVALRAE